MPSRLLVFFHPRSTSVPVAAAYLILVRSMSAWMSKTVSFVTATALVLVVIAWVASPNGPPVPSHAPSDYAAMLRTRRYINSPIRWNALPLTFGNKTSPTDETHLSLNGRARPIQPQKIPEIEFRSGPSVKAAAAPSAARKHPAVAPLMLLPGSRWRRS
jgi:hypothetical protein